MAKVLYKVLSPFLGNGKLLNFGDQIEEKDLVTGDLENRLISKHIEAIEISSKTIDPESTKKKKSFFSKSK